jgi:glycine/D-amino acid oxidase-like deaminating enzyme
MSYELLITPAAEGHGLWPWMNAPALGRDVAPLGVK